MARRKDKDGRATVFLISCIQSRPYGAGDGDNGKHGPTRWAAVGGTDGRYEGKKEKEGKKTNDGRVLRYGFCGRVLRDGFCGRDGCPRQPPSGWARVQCDATVDNETFFAIFPMLKFHAVYSSLSSHAPARCRARPRQMPRSSGTCMVHCASIWCAANYAFIPGIDERAAADRQRAPFERIQSSKDAIN